MSSREFLESDDDDQWKPGREWFKVDKKGQTVYQGGATNGVVSGRATAHAIEAVGEYPCGRQHQEASDHDQPSNDNPVEPKMAPNGAPEARVQRHSLLVCCMGPGCNTLAANTATGTCPEMKPPPRSSLYSKTWRHMKG